MNALRGLGRPPPNGQRYRCRVTVARIFPHKALRVPAPSRGRFTSWRPSSTRRRRCSAATPLIWGVRRLRARQTVVVGRLGRPAPPARPGGVTVEEEGRPPKGGPPPLPS